MTEPRLAIVNDVDWVIAVLPKLDVATHPTKPRANRRRTYTTERTDHRLIAHELMHRLGFGHACYWPSVMMVTKFQCVRVSSIPTRPTATDVAYIELVMELARLLGEHPAAWQFAEALSTAQ